MPFTYNRLILILLDSVELFYTKLDHQQYQFWEYCSTCSLIVVSSTVRSRQTGVCILGSSSGWAVVARWAVQGHNDTRVIGAHRELEWITVVAWGAGLAGGLAHQILVIPAGTHDWYSGSRGAVGARGTWVLYGILNSLASWTVVSGHAGPGHIGETRGHTVIAWNNMQRNAEIVKYNTHYVQNLKRKQ